MHSKFVLVAASVLRFGLTWDAAVASFFCAALVAISATDAERHIIPNRVVLPAAGIVLVANTILHPSPVWTVAGLGAALFLLVAALAYPAGMGMGDVKLALLLGVAVGATVPVAMMVGSDRTDESSGLHEPQDPEWAGTGSGGP